MTTRVAYAAQRSRARALPLLNLKKREAARSLPITWSEQLSSTRSAAFSPASLV